MREHAFRYSLMGIAGGLLIALAVTIPAHAAISNGPITTNSVAAEQQRIVQFYEAQQSYEEKLRVGKRRYDAKQAERAKVIAAMSSELKARQSTVLMPPDAAPNTRPNDSVSWYDPAEIVELMAVGLFTVIYYRNRGRVEVAVDDLRRSLFYSPLRSGVERRPTEARTGATPLAAETFFCKEKGAYGRGLYTPKGFMVLKGSVGSNVSVAEDKSSKPLLAELLGSGVLRKQGNTVVFEKDHLFGTPTLAAIALTGKKLNGWLEWRTKDGVTLDALHRLEAK